MNFIAYPKCLIFQVCMVIKWFQHFLFVHFDYEKDSLKKSQILLKHLRHVCTLLFNIICGAQSCSLGLSWEGQCPPVSAESPLLFPR